MPEHLCLNCLKVWNCKGTLNQIPDLNTMFKNCKSHVKVVHVLRRQSLNLHPFPFQTCWQTLWATLCRTLTSSCSLTANSSTTLPTCPSLSTALRPPPPPLRPPLLRPHSSAIPRTTTALIAWRPPVIPAPSPIAEAWLRGLEW